MSSEFMDGIIPTTRRSASTAPSLDTEQPVVLDDVEPAPRPRPATPTRTQSAPVALPRSSSEAAYTLGHAINDGTSGFGVRRAVGGSTLVTLFSALFSGFPGLMAQAGWGAALEPLTVAVKLPVLLRSLEYNTVLMRDSDVAKAVTTALATGMSGQELLTFRARVNAAWQSMYSSAALDGYDASGLRSPEARWPGVAVPIITALAFSAGYADRQALASLLRALAGASSAGADGLAQTRLARERLLAYQ